MDIEKIISLIKSHWLEIVAICSILYNICAEILAHTPVRPNSPLQVFTNILKIIIGKKGYPNV